MANDRKRPELSCFDGWEICMMCSEYAKQRPSQQHGTEAQPPRQAAKNAVDVAQKKPRAGKPQDDASYWTSRAERTKRQAARHQDQATRDHFMKIAAGYEALARSARSVGRDPD
ncbi:hypothetical protein HU230_0000855 [Bradyrhizobium quebecense]|uniref:Uncharacterized protein n=1 Tax=Bradyrhizobium quebecense TaxID=2748629 RepID=A0A974ACQ7_9BRAD|nr:hypothetical protein [Bradyrhizobium quebecense]UGA44620.1 hypothetical protein HU230_0000855 [Bradyrhizobium quebecense]